MTQLLPDSAMLQPDIAIDRLLTPQLYTRAAATLALAQELVPFPSGTLRLFDFGSCWGDSLAALADEAARRADGSFVVGSEVDTHRHAIAQQVAGSLFDVVAVVGDGLAHLEQQQGTYDVITALMFGPSHDGKLADRFLPAALGALRKGGIIVINSDLLTMRTVRGRIDAMQNEVAEVCVATPAQLAACGLENAPLKVVRH